MANPTVVFPEPRAVTVEGRDRPTPATDEVLEVTGNPDVIPEEFDVLREQGRLDVESLFSHVVDYADAPALYRELLEDRTQAMAVRIEW